MKKLISIVLFTTIMFIQAEEFYTAEQLGKVQQHVDQWYADDVHNLNFENVQILANFIHTSATAADLDYRAKQLCMKMQPAFQALQKNAFDEHNLVQKDPLIMLNASMPLICQMLSIRAIIFKRLKSCITWINDNGSPELHNALNSMQKHIQQEVIEFLKTNKQKFKSTLETAHEVTKGSSELSHVVANTYQALLDRNSPVTSNNLELQDIIDLDTATKLAEAIEQQSWRNLQSSILVFEKTLILQNLNSLLYSMYYKTAYTPNIMIIFDNDGLLTQDKWVTPLPKPE